MLSIFSCILAMYLDYPVTEGFTYCSALEITKESPLINISMKPIDKNTRKNHYIVFLNYTENNSVQISQNHTDKFEYYNWKKIDKISSRNCFFADTKPFAMLYNESNDTPSIISLCSFLINTDICPNVFISTNPNIQFEEIIKQDLIKEGNEICIFYLGIGAEMTVTNNLDPSDTLYHSEIYNNYFLPIPHGTTKTTSQAVGLPIIDTAIKIKFGKGNSNRNLSLNFSSPINFSNYVTVDFDGEKTYEEHTSFEDFSSFEDFTSNEDFTSFFEDFTSSFEDFSSFEDYSDSDYKFVEETTEMLSKVEQTLPPIINGEDEWMPEPGTIVRGQDIPEIKESVHPIQTTFIKPSIAPNVARANIGAGLIAIIVILIITIYNFYKTFKKLKDSAGRISEFECDNSFDYLISSNSDESSTT